MTAITIGPDTATSALHSLAPVPPDSFGSPRPTRHLRPFVPLDHEPQSLVLPFNTMRLIIFPTRICSPHLPNDRSHTSRFSCRAYRRDMRPLYMAPLFTQFQPAPPLFSPASNHPPLSHTPTRFASTLPGNLVSSSATLAAQVPEADSRVLLWSGWYEPATNADADPSPLAWGAGAWCALAEFCTATSARLASRPASSNTRVCFLPRTGHILSDQPSCHRFLNLRSEWTGTLAPLFEILLDPVGMLTPQMLPCASDHLERIIVGLARSPGIAGILLSNIAPDKDSVTRQPVHEGVIPTRVLADLLNKHCDPNLPLLLTGDDVPSQLAALRIA